jgi:hypothetical protein
LIQFMVIWYMFGTTAQCRQTECRQTECRFFERRQTKCRQTKCCLVRLG